MYRQVNHYYYGTTEQEEPGAFSRAKMRHQFCRISSLCCTTYIWTVLPCTCSWQWFVKELFREMCCVFVSTSVPQTLEIGVWGCASPQSCSMYLFLPSQIQGYEFYQKMKLLSIKHDHVEEQQSAQVRLGMWKEATWEPQRHMQLDDTGNFILALNTFLWSFPHCSLFLSPAVMNPFPLTMIRQWKAPPYTWFIFFSPIKAYICIFKGKHTHQIRKSRDKCGLLTIYTEKITLSQEPGWLRK